MITSAPRRAALDEVALGDLLKEARVSARLSQAEFAAGAGTTQSAVSRWERNHDAPRFDTLVRLLRTCGLTAELRIRPIDDGIDRAQIRNQLRMSPEERLASSVNVSRMLAVARRA